MSKFIPNSFQVPNALVDELLGDMSDAALRAYIIITRKTRGWNKECDRISLSQFKKIGKKSINTIRNGLNELVEKGIVIKHETAAGDVWELNDAVSNSDIADSDTVSKSDTPLYQNLTVGVSKSDNTENNYTKTTNQKTCATAKAPDAVQGMFEQFWSAYPNKKDKKNAWAKFQKINFTKNPFIKIMASLQAFKQSEAWLKNNGQYVPMPTTWINGERWNDEVLVPKSQTETLVTTYPSSQQTNQPAQAPRRPAFKLVDYAGAMPS